MTFAFTHPRSTWEDPAKPIKQSGQSPAFYTRIDTEVCHYTADDDLIDGDPGEHADQLDEYMRAMQASYLRTRGYSLGYCVAIDWLGGSWEIRGWDIQTAANVNHNNHTFAILFLVDGADRPTDLAIAEARRIGAELNRRCRAARPLQPSYKVHILGHGQLRNPTAATACPGRGILTALAEGVFDPDYAPEPPPQPQPAPEPTPNPPTPQPEDEDMPRSVHIVAVDTNGSPVSGKAEGLLTVDGAGVSFVQWDGTPIKGSLEATFLRYEAAWNAPRFECSVGTYDSFMAEVRKSRENPNG